MSKFWPVFRAEIIKQKQQTNSGHAVFFSLLLWPVLTFFSVYFAMKPYQSGKGSALSSVIPDGNVEMFLLSGFLVFQLFWTVVQSAWQFEWERKQGTLEMIFLTPASKMAFLFGRSVFSLFNGIWMFLSFCILTFFFIGSTDETAWGYLGLSFIIMFGSAIVWGSFLCAICLFSRDSGYLYYIFQAPMNLFGGVRVPPVVFPLWAKTLSFLFPVTYCLFLVREALSGKIGPYWWLTAIGLVAINLFLVLVTMSILTKAESHARKKGNWTMF